MSIYTKMSKRAGVAGFTAPLFDNGSAWMVRDSSTTRSKCTGKGEENAPLAKSKAAQAAAAVAAVRTTDL